MNKDNYESILHEKFPYIDVLGEYVNSRTKILHRCNIHKYEWNTSPENLIRLCKYGCRICESESNNHISEKYSVNFYTELKKINPHFDDITFNTKEINGSKTIVNCTCKKCGHNWNITANALINKKSGCGRCSGAYRTHCSTVKHDKIKNEYCISHNIDLIRIPYWNYESIENILRDYLSTKRAV